MLFLIQKRLPKKYLNSPVEYLDICTVEAETIEGAAIRAMLILETARLRVLPANFPGDEWISKDGQG